MHDARWFEEAGKPAVALCSDAFVEQARYQADILDAASVPQVFVAHPISDQTTQQMHLKADRAFEELYAAITTTWTPPTGALLSSEASEAEAACST